MRTKLCLSALLLSVLATGCATQVTIHSTPPGAVVYTRGSGRAAFQWELKGHTPVTYKSWYSVEKSFVTWPDGTRSAVIRTPLGMQREVEVIFTHPKQAQHGPVRQ